jgi:hypothetical protein
MNGVNMSFRTSVGFQHSTYETEPLKITAVRISNDAVVICFTYSFVHKVERLICKNQLERHSPELLNLYLSPNLYI